MAGFWTGLVHGTLLCGATLAALSLAFPRAGREAERVTPAAVAGAEGEPSPPAGGQPVAPVMDTGPVQAVVTGRTATQPDNGASDGGSAPPAIERLPDPVGSEFRRGSDDPPTVPAVSPPPAQGEVPRSVASGAETAPVTVPVARDVAPLSQAPAAPVLLAPGGPQPQAPALADAPVAAPLPAQVAAPGEDRLPEPSRPDDAATVEDAEAASGQMQAGQRETVLAVPLAGGSARPGDQEGAAGSVQSAGEEAGAGNENVDVTARQQPVDSADPSDDPRVAGPVAADESGMEAEAVQQSSGTPNLAANGVPESAGGADAVPAQPDAAPAAAVRIVTEPSQEPSGAAEAAETTGATNPAQGADTALTSTMTGSAEARIATEAPRQPSGPAEETDTLADAPAPARRLAGEPPGGASTPARRAPRPAPDLSIPRAFAPASSRAAPALPQPAAATPPEPDLSDLNPGAPR